MNGVHNKSFRWNADVLRSWRIARRSIAGARLADGFVLFVSASVQEARSVSRCMHDVSDLRLIRRELGTSTSTWTSVPTIITQRWPDPTTVSSREDRVMPLLEGKRWRPEASDDPTW